jgi:hypothetical protein
MSGTLVIQSIIHRTRMSSVKYYPSEIVEYSSDRNDPYLTSEPRSKSCIEEQCCKKKITGSGFYLLCHAREESRLAIIIYQEIAQGEKVCGDSF